MPPSPPLQSSSQTRNALTSHFPKGWIGSCQQRKGRLRAPEFVDLTSSLAGASISKQGVAISKFSN